MLEEVPGEPLPRRRGRPPTVTREDVIDAAVTVLDREGFDAVAIRSVAKELGMDPRSLYTYVSGVDELLRALAVRVVGEMLSHAGDLGPDRASVLRVYHLLHETSATHPDLLSLVFNAPDEMIAAALPAIDAVVGYLRAQGLSAARTWFVYRALYMFCLGHGAMSRALRPDSAAQRSRHLMDLLEEPGFRGSEVGRLLVDSASFKDDFEAELALLLDTLVAVGG